MRRHRSAHRGRKEPPLDSLFTVIEFVWTVLMWVIGCAVLICTAPLWLPRWLWAARRHRQWRNELDAKFDAGPQPPTHGQCRSTLQDSCVEAMNKAYRRDSEGEGQD